MDIHVFSKDILDVLNVLRTKFNDSTELYQL